MTEVGSLSSSAAFDRAEYARQYRARNGGPTDEEMAKQREQSDLHRLDMGISREGWNRGEGVYLYSITGSGQKFYDPVGAAHVKRQMYGNYVGAGATSQIRGLDVDFVLGKVDEVEGDDTENIVYYASYLRGEMHAAAVQGAEIEFEGTWGGDRVTNDLEEYIGWLAEAARIDPSALATRAPRESDPVPVDPESQLLGPWWLRNAVRAAISGAEDVASGKPDTLELSPIKGGPGTSDSGPVWTTVAQNVDLVMGRQERLFGNNLRYISSYMEYLKDEAAAASVRNAEFRFTGAWGTDRVTHDVNEYMGWLLEAAQLKSEPIQPRSAA